MSQILSFFSKTKALSFEEQVLPYKQMLFSMAYRYTGSHADAEDLLQELLIDLLSKEQQLIGIENTKSFLHKCLYNKFIDTYRKNKRHENTENNESEIISFADHVSAPDAQVLHQQIIKSLQKLSPSQRAMICLHDMDGHTLPSLSEILDKPLGTLKSDLHRAREKIKMLLDLQPSDLNLRQYKKGE